MLGGPDMHSLPSQFRQIAFLAFALGATDSASASLILLSQTRTLTAENDSNFQPPEQAMSSAGSFAQFQDSVGVTGAFTTMFSTLSSTHLHLTSGTSVFLDGSQMPQVEDPFGNFIPGYISTVAEMIFQVSFRLVAPTRVEIDGYRDRGLWGYWDSTLTGPSGDMPLVWTGPAGIPDNWDNFLIVRQTLAPGDYTFVGRTVIGINMISIDAYDGSHVRLDLDLRVEAVPDAGPNAALLTACFLGLLGMRTVGRMRRCETVTARAAAA